MKNTTTNTVNATNDIGMIASLFGCAVLSVAILANAFATPAAVMPTQKMDTIVVTAKRVAAPQMARINFAPIVVTAQRIVPAQMAHITLAPMVITAQRIAV